MKHLLLFTIILSFSIPSASSQVAVDYTFGDVQARLQTDGLMFTKEGEGEPGLNYPANTDLATIFSASLWFSAEDENGQVKTEGQDYYGGRDYQFGPVAHDRDAAHFSAYNNFFPITRAEVQAHYDHFEALGNGETPPAYEIPQSILNWPAQGVLENGEAQYLAPFYDHDEDGSYDPSQGDFPYFCGDFAIWHVFNDDKTHQTTGGERLKIEVHALYFGFISDDPVLDRSIFAQYTFHNRSQTPYQNFKAGVWADFDIGNYGDDYVGCAPGLNMFYAYNGDQEDEDSNFGPGYGTEIPAQAIISLDQQLSAFLPLSGELDSSADVINSLNGLSMNGQPIYSPSGEVTNYAYTDNPNMSSGFSEVNSQTPPGDRKAIGAYAYPNQNSSTYQLTLAFLTSEPGDNLETVNDLYAEADMLQNMNVPEGCIDYYLTISVQEQEALAFDFYPNPSQGKIEILSNESGLVNLIDQMGKVVFSQSIRHGNQELTFQNTASGLYILEIISENGQRKSKRLMLD